MRLVWGIAVATTLIGAGAVEAQEAGATDWGGFYAGVFAGYALDKEPDAYEAMTIPPNPIGYPIDTLSTFDGIDTAVGGLRAGWNYQHEAFVLGVEGAISLGGFSKRDVFTAYGDDGGDPLSFTDVDQAYSFDASFLTTLTGRAGVSFDNWLLYGKAGLAMAHATGQFDSQLTRVDVGAPENNVDMGNTSRTEGLLFGSVVGIGAEVMVSEGISVGAEYTLTHLPEHMLVVASPSGSAPVGMGDTDFHALTAGVNFRF